MDQPNCPARRLGWNPGGGFKERKSRILFVPHEAGDALDHGSSDADSHCLAYAPHPVPIQCDETYSEAACAGGIAKVSLMRLTSAKGVNPKSRLNSLLNCDALAYPTA